MTTLHDERIIDEAARLVGDSTIPADVRLMQLRELIGKDTRPKWRVTTTLDKYDGDWTTEQIAAGDATHAHRERAEFHGNLLTIGGASALWQLAFQASPAAPSFSAPYLGVSDSSTAAAQSDTATTFDSATNKTRKTATVTHTDSTSSAGSLTITLVSTFGTTDANHRWLSWGVLSGSTGGRLLNRKVETLDGGSAKTSAQSWQLTVTISLA